MDSCKGTILVTGANGGFGSAIVSQIVESAEFASYHGLYTVRNAGSATRLRKTLARAKLPHAYDVLALDLSDLTNVREVAAAINGRVRTGELPPIRALVLNAGLVEPTTQSISKNGLDMMFASNYLGHWLLTLLLLQSMDADMGRIIAVSSSVHDPDDPHTRSSGHVKDEKWRQVFHDDENVDAVAKGTWSGPENVPYWKTWHSGQRRYGASKLCLVMMIGELQRRLDSDPALSNISVLGIDPGTMPTDLTRRAPWAVHILIFKIIMPILCTFMCWIAPAGFLRTTQRSASDTLKLAFETGPPLCEQPKGWYMNGLQRREPSAESQDVKKRQLLWKDSVRYTQLTRGETSLEYWN